MAKPGTNKLSFSELLLDQIITHPDVAVDFIQAMARMMGYDDGNNMWRFLAVDGDGRLELSLASQAGDTGVNSAVNVTATQVTVLAANPDRKGFRVQNLGSNDVYLAYGNTATTAAGFLLGANMEFEENYYTGIVTGISAAGTQPCRVLEIS